MNLIYAINKNNFIGKDGSLMYSFAKDMKFFKETTEGNTLVFGYKTFMEIGKPLKGRKTIVIVEKSRNHETVDGVVYVNDLDEAIDYWTKNPYGELFVCGGKTLYDKVFNEYRRNIDYIYETIVDDDSYGTTSIDRDISRNMLQISHEEIIDFDRISKKDYSLHFRVYKNSLQVDLLSY